MEGDKRVEIFIGPVREALDRQGITGAARTDIYNRAYEAIHNVIQARFALSTEGDKKCATQC